MDRKQQDVSWLPGEARVALWGPSASPEACNTSTPRTTNWRRVSPDLYVRCLNGMVIEAYRSGCRFVGEDATLMSLRNGQWWYRVDNDKEVGPFKTLKALRAYIDIRIMSGGRGIV